MPGSDAAAEYAAAGVAIGLGAYLAHQLQQAVSWHNLVLWFASSSDDDVVDVGLWMSGTGAAGGDPKKPGKKFRGGFKKWLEKMKKEFFGKRGQKLAKEEMEEMWKIWNDWGRPGS